MAGAAVQHRVRVYSTRRHRQAPVRGVTSGGDPTLSGRGRPETTLTASDSAAVPAFRHRMLATSVSSSPTGPTTSDRRSR